MSKGVDAITSKLNRLIAFQKNAMTFVMDAVVNDKDIVIDMVFEEQLFTDGINGLDVPIMDFKPYSPFTEMIKKEKGQPFDRVTLRGEGDFHDGGDLRRLDNVTSEIFSSDEKSESLQDKYGKEIFFLKQDNKNEISHFYVKPHLLKKLNAI